MYKNTGYLSIEEYSSLMPEEERLNKGSVAIIECPEHIPCNPCQQACPRGAIQPFQNITDLPVINFDLCNGCGNCIAVCPGLAIYVIEKNFTPDTSLMKIPYEMLPIPEKNDICDILSREGSVIGRGRVERVQKYAFNPKGRVIWVEIPKKLYKEARNVRMVKE
jgi:Fe-S-cluster-containing hydrogenase component 2